MCPIHQNDPNVNGLYYFMDLVIEFCERGSWRWKWWWGAANVTKSIYDAAAYPTRAYSMSEKMSSGCTIPVRITCLYNLCLRNISKGVVGEIVIF